MAIDEARLEAFMGQALQDLGATMSATLVLLGDKLGLYKGMAGEGPLTAAELAEQTDTDERYVGEWLNAQAAGGYVVYDAATGTYTLPDEQAAVLADDNSPYCMIGGFETALSAAKAEPKLRSAFSEGHGVGWHEHDCGVFSGTARFFRPGYLARLTAEWIPALDGVEAKLRAGAKVADIGCGHGISTVILARAFPKSEFVGFDYHGGSIEAARCEAEKAGVADRCRFEVASAESYPGSGYDLVTMFDCLHDMGDPVGAARHVGRSLAEGGTWMIVEPFAHDQPQDNHNPVGRVYYSASTMLCTPASKSQDVGLALGAQAGEARLRAVTAEGGFTRFRRAAETPFNFVFEARA
jgi:SAM-dependent methyltransferase